MRMIRRSSGDIVGVRGGYPACTADRLPKAPGTGNGQNGYVWYLGTGANMCSLYADTGKNSTDNRIYLNNCGVMYVNSSGSTWSPVTTGCGAHRRSCAGGARGAQSP